MNISKAFNDFNKQNRVVEKITINPEDLDGINADKDYGNGKYYKWTSEVVLDKEMPRGSFELLSIYPNELKQRF